MNEYTKYKRGSEWRKWDLHIHTPGTKKNDRFEGKDLQEKWLKFSETINNSAEDITVIGITDYFSIENYFKFKELILNNTITKKFELILPNIELRVLPVTGSSTPINLHCIFNPSIDQEIESRFLGKLKFTNSKSSYSATKDELVRFGRDHSNNSTLETEAAYKKGVEQYVVDLDSLRTIFKSDPLLRDNTIIVVSNRSTDGVTGLVKHEDFFINKSESQLDATRQGYYQFADAIFSSNEKDKNYFIGKGVDGEKIVLSKCGSLKPCFHGCDAHSNDKVFKPDDNRFCWIKADPTFEGLKQTLYEPEDRVKIQTLRPDVKNDRHIISELHFIDNSKLFGNQKILLNENLNAIIGGKSAGKSLLLYSIAKSIDPDQVDRTSKRLGFDGYNFNATFNFDVIWKNGDIDQLVGSTNKNNKIIYIPQLYINYLVEKNNKEDLNNLIENILFQDAEFKKFYEQKKNEIYIASNEISDLLTKYLEIRAKALETGQKIKDTGKSDVIAKSIEKIQASILEGQKASNLSAEDSQKYNDLINQKSKSEKELKDLIDKEIVLNKIVTEVNNTKIHLLGKSQTEDQIPLKGSIDRILDELIEIPEDILSIKSKIESDYVSLLSNLRNEIINLNIKSKKEELQKAIILIDNELKPFLLKIAGQKELQKLIAQLENEKNKMQLALNFEKQFATYLNDYKNLRVKTANALKSRYDKYREIVKKINETKNDIGSEIKLQCSVILKQDSFALFNQVNRAAIASDNLFNSLFQDGYVLYDKIVSLYENQLKVLDNKLIIDPDGKISFPLKQKINLEDILKGLTQDSFILDYTVTYKGDDLLNMSPGKKGTVLLILFLQISSSEYPILIDQPEDNLDNRTIYELLCKMIKSKKKERQIIIVSHNANLVVATDTENIIVANQEGQDSLEEVGRYRFEYVNGSLEYTFPKVDKIAKILHQQGIREHVCDILEGGNEAFKQRERKYSIK